MKAVTNMIQNREKKILKFLLKEGHTTVSEIATYMGISDKTISNSLKEIESFLTTVNLSLVRKPKVGVYIEGDIRKILPLLDNQAERIPSTKEERFIYIYSSLLRNDDYITIQQLSDELFISRGTIERDLAKVEKMLKKDGVLLHKKPSKGMKLNISEQGKRALTSRFIQNFWGENWYIKQENQDFTQTFEKIQADLQGLFSAEYLSAIIETTREFSDTHDFYFTDYAFQSLVIHLAIAMERIRKKEYVAHTEIIYSVENSQKENTLDLVNLLSQRLEIEIPDFEIGYINTHLVAAYAQWNHTTEVQPESLNDQQKELTEVITDTLNPNQYDSDLLEGLEVHLQSAINRLQYNLSIQNPYKDTIKQNFQLAFEQALFLKGAIEKHYEIRINDDETAYIAMHFQAYLERNKANASEIRAILVCSTGLGSSRLLSARIKKYFPQIRIEKILSVQELMKDELAADLIISTIYLEMENIPTVVVSPLMDEGDIKSLERNLLNNQYLPKTSNKPFTDLLAVEQIYLKEQFETMESCITEIGRRLVETKIVTQEFTKSALAREELSYTSFGSIATPHGNPDYVLASRIVIVTLEKAISWGDELVDKLFFIALQKDPTLDLDKIYEVLYDLIDNQVHLDKILNKKNATEIYDYLVKDGN